MENRSENLQRPAWDERQVCPFLVGAVHEAVSALHGGGGERCNGSALPCSFSPSTLGENFASFFSLSLSHLVLKL